jgi:signal transduction histidine kinase
MTAEKLLYLASLVIFAFGTLTFFVLSISYWREWIGRRTRRGSAVFPVFTVVCAAACLMNLLVQTPLFAFLNPEWMQPMLVARNLAASLLPPILLHLVYDMETTGLRARAMWRAVVAVVYAGCVLYAVLEPLGDLAGRSSAIALCAAGALGLAMQMSSRRVVGGAQRSHRNWVRGLLALIVVSAAAGLTWPGAFMGLMPDYLVLAFFCVSLYYRARLAFFDLLVKRGLFFLAGLVMLTAWFAAAGPITARADWNAVIIALLLLPFWLVGPWIYRVVERAVDRVWLRRRYSAADAERQFLQDVQASANEDDLRTRASSSLGEIFQAAVTVEIGDAAHSAGSEDGLTATVAGGGWIAVAPRRDGIPYLSDDRRCLLSLAASLSVVLENVRFRQDRLRQAEREQELRWLASRAELKALRAQINPHFLFNALNSIAGLIAEQPQLADETIERLGRVFRYTLRKSEKEWVPLREEVEFIEAYLQVEQARFGDRLSLAFNVQPDAGQVPIPAMSIQPLIENAIKHGVAAMEGPGMVALAARVEDGSLHVEVRDNGPGFPVGYSLGAPGNGGGSHGLSNVMERLHGYYGTAARIEWTGGPDGTRVCLTIPSSHAVGR